MQRRMRKMRIFQKASSQIKSMCFEMLFVARKERLIFAFAIQTKRSYDKTTKSSKKNLNLLTMNTMKELNAIIQINAIQ